MSKTTHKFSPEVRERAVRLVLDNQGQPDESRRETPRLTLRSAVHAPVHPVVSGLQHRGQTDRNLQRHHAPDREVPRHYPIRVPQRR